MLTAGSSGPEIYRGGTAEASEAEKGLASPDPRNLCTPFLSFPILISTVLPLPGMPMNLPPSQDAPGFQVQAQAFYRSSHGLLDSTPISSLCLHLHYCMVS